MISVSQITSTRNTTVTFTRTQCVIKTRSLNSTEQIQFHLPKDGTLFSLRVGVEPLISTGTAETLQQFDLDVLKWHYRLGHINIRFLNLMTSNNMVTGLPNLKSTLSLCKGCLNGKQTKQTYPTDGATRAIVPLALIHMDLCGPMHTSSLGGASYFVLFIDYFTRFTTIYFLSKKSKALSFFQDYKRLVENQFSDDKILILRYDNGGEFTSKAFFNLCLT